MNKRKKRNKSQKSRGRKRVSQASKSGKLSNETPAAEAVTVAWLLCLLATIAAVALALIGRAFYWRNPTDQAGMASGVLTFTSSVTGAFTLALTVAVTRVRRVAPPVGLLRIAAAVGVLPFIVWAGLAWL